MTEPENYRFFIEREWADLHHSRVQEWTALGVVAGAHLGLIQLSSFAIREQISANPRVIVHMACLFGIVLSLIGALMTCRHRRLMQIQAGMDLSGGASPGPGQDGQQSGWDYSGFRGNAIGASVAGPGNAAPFINERAHFMFLCYFLFSGYSGSDAAMIMTAARHRP